jgi:hypothetical protein
VGGFGNFGRSLSDRAEAAYAVTGKDGSMSACLAIFEIDFNEVVYLKSLTATQISSASAHCVPLAPPLSQRARLRITEKYILGSSFICRVQE